MADKILSFIMGCSLGVLTGIVVGELGGPTWAQFMTFLFTVYAFDIKTMIT